MQKNKLVGIALALVVGASLVGGAGFSSKAQAANAFLTLDSFSGRPGSTVRVSGGNYTPDETVNIFLGSTLNPPVATSIARGDSLFGPVDVVIPANTVQGSMLITGVGATSGASASNSYFVQGLNPTLSVTTTTVNQPGNMINIQGAGFLANEAVTVSLSTASVTVNADGGGNFNTQLMIPFVNSATYTVRGVGQSSFATATTFFFVGGFFPSVTLSKYFLKAGETLSFNGNGFSGGETIDVFVGNAASATGTPLSTFTAQSSGSFTNAGGFSVPFTMMNTSPTVTVKGRQSHATAEATFTVGSFFPTITPSVYFLQRGDSFSVRGEGFAGNESVTARVFGNTPRSVFADAAGTVGIGPLVVSSAAPSQLMITLTGASSGASVSTTITVGDMFPQTVVTSTLNVFLTVNNASGGTATPGNFTITMTGANSTPATFIGNASGTTVTVNGDTGFTIGASIPTLDYSTTMTGDCGGSAGIVGGTTGRCDIAATFAPPTITLTPTLANGTIGAAYSSTITASTTAVGPFTWSIASGTLPAGLTINASSTGNTLTISGTPTATGTSQFTIGVLGGSSSGNQAYTFTVGEPAPVTTGGTTGGGGGGGMTVIVSGGGGGGGGGFTPVTTTPLAPNAGVTTGQVLGASTGDLVAMRTQLLSLTKRLIGLQFKQVSCPASFNQNLSQGARSESVRNLQRALNASTMTQVSVSGSGSPGNETIYFGPATAKAVAAFQNIFANEILLPAGLTVGNGFVGANTRAQLNALCSGVGASVAT